jgi:hypothetical protein
VAHTRADRGRVARRRATSGLGNSAQHAFFSGSDPVEATRQFETVLDSGVPDRFAALARLHLLNLALREGDLDRGLIQLEALRQQPLALKTESGLPLRLVAEWRWLQWLAQNAPDTAQFEDCAAVVAALAVAESGPASAWMIDNLGDLAPAITRDWLSLWIAHQKARAFAGLLQDTGTLRILRVRWICDKLG